MCYKKDEIEERLCHCDDNKYNRFIEATGIQGKVIRLFPRVFLYYFFSGSTTSPDVIMSHNGPKNNQSIDILNEFDACVCCVRRFLLKFFFFFFLVELVLYQNTKVYDVSSMRLLRATYEN